MSGDAAHERQREIGRRVARWRIRRGLTRRQFADLCGRSLSWVDKVEGGERSLLRLPMLERVAEVLHVSVEALTDTAAVRPVKHSLDVFEIAAIRAAMRPYQAISRVFTPLAAELPEPPSLDRLAQQVTYAWTAFQNAHWPLLGRALPRLLTTAPTVLIAYSGVDDQARRARTLLSQTYQVTASTLWKLNEPDLAWLAAERGFVLAEETGDGLLLSEAARRLGTGSATHLSLYGMLFLMGAVVAARASNHAVARELLDEGHNVARMLGYDGNECYTAFGPTNAHLHRVAVLLDLGAGAGAVAAAGQVTSDGLDRLPKERRAHYHIDVARAHGLCGHHDDAVNTLLMAANLFPDEIRCRPTAVDLVDGLRRTARGPRSEKLEQLAGRIGLAYD